MAISFLSSTNVFVGDPELDSRLRGNDNRDCFVAHAPRNDRRSFEIAFLPFSA